MWRSCTLRRGVVTAVYFLICIDLVTSSSAPPVDIIEKVAGNSVTLQPKYSGSPAGISWWLNGHILVDIQLKPQKQDYSYPAFSLLKDNADIDHSRGYLTIRDLTEAESGYYRAEVVVGEKILVTHTRLIVLPQAREVLETESGGSITLQPKYSGDPSEISWWKATDILVDLQLKPSEYIGYYHFKGRAAIDKITGQLTISNLTKADSGLYRAEVMVDDRTQYMGVKLTVLGSGGRGGPDRRVTGAIIGAGLILAVLILILYYCRGQSGAADRVEPGDPGLVNGEADGVSDRKGACKHFLDNVVQPQHLDTAGSAAPALEDETEVERTGKLDEITAL
ncbi:uncharacterized protein [Hyperolius riggenbachi]|uniref:uncharacterized protein isoform X3 n=1 Tax=Hyperolius riggenbachi TaxID=752182 RepID=UPI0035A2F87C